MVKKENVWAVISARSGSKSIKDKNIYKLNKIPLLAYSIKAALISKSINKVLVSTNSEYYAKISKKYGAEVPFLRPKKISGSQSTDLELFKHLIKFYEKKEINVPEILVHLRPTTPLRDPNVIDKAIKLFQSSNFTALRSVHKNSSSVYKNFEISNFKLKQIFTRKNNIEESNLPRQQFPATYQANGYVDIIRKSMIKKDIIHGNRVRSYITGVTADIDEESDLKYLEFLINTDRTLFNKLFK